ncbi:MAG: hypothetical protein ABI399_08335 [Bauldia sp.]
MTEPSPGTHAAASSAYLLALGRATYNFACLEWSVKQLMERLRPGHLEPKHSRTAGELAEDFLHAARKTDLSDAAINDLVDAGHRFRAMVPIRNDLLHAHPVTAANGEAMLARNHTNSFNTWERAEIDEAADSFAEVTRAVAEVQRKYLA